MSLVVIVRVGNSTEVMVEEGASVTLCAEIESPLEVERDIFILGQLLPGTAKGVRPECNFHNVIL